MSRTVKSIFICPTQDFTRGDATVADLLKLQLARLTRSAVAHLSAGVVGTVEYSTTHFVTLEHRSLAAAHRLTGLPTNAGFCYKGRTLWTRSRVT